MACPPEVVIYLGPQVLELEAELEAVPPLDPVGLVIELESIAWKRCLEVVTEIEIALRPDLGDRRNPRIVRKPDTKILRRRDVRMGPPRRMEAVVAERRLVEQRRAERSLPSDHDALAAWIRLEAGAHVA